MAMLSRYQKAGGFLQLLQLIETCGKQKQDNFLQMIETENTRWAAAIREKMITIEKIMSWPDAVLAEVAGRLQQLTLATAMHGLKEEDRNRLLQTYSHSQRRIIDDLFKAKTSNPAEVSSAFIKILQEVRSMLQNGYLRPEKFAPELHLPEDIEDSLGKDVLKPSSVPLTPSAPHKEVPVSFEEAMASPAAKPSPVKAVPSHAAHGGSHEQDLNFLRTKVNQLTHENNQLKHELQILRDKLTQIKRIA